MPGGPPANSTSIESSFKNGWFYTTYATWINHLQQTAGHANMEHGLTHCNINKLQQTAGHANVKLRHSQHLLFVFIVVSCRVPTSHCLAMSLVWMEHINQIIFEAMPEYCRRLTGWPDNLTSIDTGFWRQELQLDAIILDAVSLTQCYALNSGIMLLLAPSSCRPTDQAH